VPTGSIAVGVCLSGSAETSHGPNRAVARNAKNTSQAMNEPGLRATGRRLHAADAAVRRSPPP
jgi:hypothetical protein